MSSFTRRLLGFACSALATGLLLAPYPLGAEQQSGRLQLETFSTGLATLKASFSQTVVDPDGVVQDSSAGQVWLSRPGLFRWSYGGDFPELVVADGERIWIYDEMLEQVTVKLQSAEGVDSPLSLLTDTARLDQQFEVREAGEMDGRALLELRSRSEDGEFERILLGLECGEIVLMILEDAFGLRTELHFEDVQRNLPLEDDLFRFTPPDGVDVIGDLPEDLAQP